MIIICNLPDKRNLWCDNIGKTGGEPCGISKRKTNQTTGPNNIDSIEVVAKDFPDLLSFWVEVYFRYEVTTSERSQKEQRRDLNIFLQYMEAEVGNTLRSSWTPRLSDDFIRYMQAELNADTGKRRWGDRVINRTLAHLKSFARWIHKWRPFELGEPMAKIRMVPVASLLDIEKALTKSERRDLLDAADLLVVSGELSRNRRLYKNDSVREKRKGYRAFRNRAIVYALIETGMRRTAVVRINNRPLRGRLFIESCWLALRWKGLFLESPKKAITYHLLRNESSTR